MIEAAVHVFAGIRTGKLSISSIIGRYMTKFLKGVRPNAQFDEDDVLRTAGWYARMGLGPVLRGSILRWRFGRASFPLFVGSGVKIYYGRQMELGAGVSLGSNSRVNAFSVSGIQIGDRVTLREGAWIQCASSPANPGARLTVGDGTYIGPQVILGVGGAIHIGADVQFGAGCVLISENHQHDDHGPASQTAVTRHGIEIGDGCWLGHRVTVLDGVRLGAGCIVGAGAVVTRSFPAGSTLVGVPARPIDSAAGRQP